MEARGDQIRADNVDTNGKDGNGKDDANDKPRTGRGLSDGSKKTYFQKGHHRVGRQLGSQNRITTVLKDALLLRQLPRGPTAKVRTA
jgi:hypothetical protein